MVSLRKKRVTCLYLLISMSFSVSSYIQSISVQLGVYPVWLVVSTPLKHTSQLGLLFPIYGEKTCSTPPIRLFNMFNMLYHRHNLSDMTGPSPPLTPPNLQCHRHPNGLHPIAHPPIPSTCDGLGRNRTKNHQFNMCYTVIRYYTMFCAAAMESFYGDMGFMLDIMN
jgi:hypothetical protein